MTPSHSPPPPSIPFRPPVALACLWLVIPNRYDFKAILPGVAGFFDAQKAGVGLGSLQPSSQAAYNFLETPTATSDPVTGGYFVTGWDYVKVGDGWGGGGA